MNENVEFIKFPKIARFSRNVIVTEKIDGTNASVYIGRDGEFLTGKRTSWITPKNDNYGFSAWAHLHKDELMQLGPGLHYGEWWGSGINRGYGLANGVKRFSLFNTVRWCLYGHEPQRIPKGDPNLVVMQDVLPECVGLVPVLWTGNFDELDVYAILEELKSSGSRASPGFMNPEGIVVFHTAANVCMKKTLKNDV